MQALVAHGLNVDIGAYPGVPRSITTVVPVPAGFLRYYVVFLQNYAVVADTWHANLEGAERAILPNILQWFELAVMCEYIPDRFRTAAAEFSQNGRVPVWPSAIIELIRAL